jgi:CubicO group peptidase (beta-lactamase class C family)
MWHPTHLLAFLLLISLISHASSAYNWTSVDLQIADKIAKGYFSGCVLGIFTPNTTILKKAYGTLFPRMDLYAPPVNLNAMFDVNFLTQVLGINSGLMQLYDEQKINVTDKVSKYVSDYSKNNKSQTTLAHLLLHNSGLQATYTEDFGKNAT